MNKKLIFISGLLVILIGTFVLLNLNPKDTWICKDGVWVRKGSPKMSQPITPCAGGNTKMKLPVVPPESALVGFYTSIKKEDTYTQDSYKLSPYLSDLYIAAIEKKKPGENPVLCSKELFVGITPKKTSLQDMKAIIQFEQKFKSEIKAAIAYVQVEKDVWKITNIACSEK